MHAYILKSCIPLIQLMIVFFIQFAMQSTDSSFYSVIEIMCRKIHIPRIATLAKQA